MWVLLAAAFALANPGASPEPHATVLATFPTARACSEAKRDVEKMLAESLNPTITSWGLECAEVKLDKFPKVPEKAKS